MTLSIEHDVALAPKTTLGLGGAARRFIRITHGVGELQEALADAALAGDRVLVLGGGSNLVVGDAGWDGLAIQIGIDRVEIQLHDDHAIVSAFAGVVWDDFVARMIESGLAGVECLSGIPGHAGATPMQNVGAYGQEVADTIVLVRALDRQTGQIVAFDRTACAFAYRASMFRGNDRYIILEVRFRFARSTDSAPIRYAELARALGISEGARAPLQHVRATVIALRRGKGMVVDPTDPDSRSAGSFFTNPIVDAAPRVPADAPRWPQPDGRTKLSAAWLIERAGFTKGTTRGHVGISTKHALALVTRTGATTSELLAFATEIQERVHTTFGIELVREPIVI